MKSTCTYLLCSLLLFFFSCSQGTPSVPKPRGYPRVVRDSSTTAHHLGMFYFRYSDDAKLIEQKTEKENLIWFNMKYPKFDATLYCSCIQLLQNEFQKIKHDNELLLYEQKGDHTNIFQLEFYSPDSTVYGRLYHLDGNTIAPYQFYLTDSLNFFLRGSLYYDKQVHTDSVAAITKSLQHDMKNLMETFQLKPIK